MQANALAVTIRPSVTHQPFSTKSFPLASFSNAALLRARKSQKFDTAFSASTALNPLSTVLFPSEHFSRRCPLKAHPPGPSRPGRQTRYPLACSQAVYFSIYQAGNPTWHRLFMTIDHNNIAVGRYLVSPLAKPQGEGRYAASVSIRSGRGSATHDRVMRFTGLFDSAAAAVHYATEHALRWIHERSAPVCA